MSELGSKSKTKQAPRGRSTADMTAAAAQNLRTEADTRIKFDRSRPRENGADIELNLSVPSGTVPEGFTGLWVPDDDRGTIQKMLAQWWGHVTDAQGVNISRSSGSGRVYLMAIENEYKKEIDDLREKNYRASIGENDSKSLGEGLESYTPNGVSNKIKVSSDPFAS